MGRYTSEDAGPQRGWIMRSHVDSRKETSATKVLDCEIPHRLG